MLFLFCFVLLSYVISDSEMFSIPFILVFFQRLEVGENKIKLFDI